MIRLPPRSALFPFTTLFLSGLGHSDHPSVVFSDGNRVLSTVYARYFTLSDLNEIAGWRALWLEWPSAGNIPWLSANLPEFERPLERFLRTDSSRSCSAVL